MASNGKARVWVLPRDGRQHDQRLAPGKKMQGRSESDAPSVLEGSVLPSSRPRRWNKETSRKVGVKSGAQQKAARKADGAKGKN